MTTIEFRVGKGKTDMRAFHVVILGEGPGPFVDGPVDEPDVTMTLTPNDLDAIVAGETTLDVGYMRGTIKVTGNVGRMLSVLPLITTEEFGVALGDAGREAASG